jgi:hypothetical protein
MRDEELLERIALDPKIMAGKPDELRPEYNLGELLKDGVQGKFTDRFRDATNLVCWTRVKGKPGSKGSWTKPTITDHKDPSIRFAICIDTDDSYSLRAWSIRP